MVNKDGVLSFDKSNLTSDFIAQISSGDVDLVNKTLESVQVLCEGVEQWIEPYVLSTLPAILDALANPKTSEHAKRAGEAIIKKVKRPVLIFIYCFCLTRTYWVARTSPKC